MKSVNELSLIKVDILQCYEAVRTALNALAESIRADHDFPIMMANVDLSVARQKAIEGIQTLFAARGQSPNHTINCLGVLGASVKTLSLITEVNEKKLAFKDAMTPLAKQQRMATDPENPERKISTPLARVILREMNLGGLLQRQVTRQIIALDYKPLRIGFTMTARSPSVVRITIEQARNRLIRLGDDYAIQQQLFLLDKLDENEMLAVVTPVPQHVRQNIAYITETGVKCNTQKKTSLPLFYPAKVNDALPKITLRDSLNPKRERADREIEHTPFLPAIHAHRYLPGVRALKSQQVEYEI